MTERMEFKDEDELKGSLMSNLDHEVDAEVAKRLKTDSKLWASYPGEAFYGYCWFEEGQFHCSVMRYGRRRGTYSAKNPKKLMGLVIQDYGPL